MASKKTVPGGEPKRTGASGGRKAKPVVKCVGAGLVEPELTEVNFTLHGERQAVRRLVDALLVAANACNITYRRIMVSGSTVEVRAHGTLTVSTAEALR